MRNILPKILFGFAALLIIAAFAETNYAQRRIGRVYYSKQSIENLLERIEERSDKFSGALNKSLDRSRLDGTRAEDNILERARDLEDRTDELRREFDHNDRRGETTANVRKVMLEGSRVNRVMRMRRFSPLAENSWLNLRNQLNQLARIYNLPVIGSRAYRF